MNRRIFLSAFSGIAASIGALKARTVGYGYVDVTRSVVLRHRGVYLRALFDGEDVTDHCFEADDQIGYVGLFKTNEHGDHYIDFSKNPPEAAREWKHGRVEFLSLSFEEFERRRVRSSKYLA